MKKLFITSSFYDVAQYFENFCGENIWGKTVTFIPTASVVEDYTQYVDDDRNALIKLGLIVEDLNISNKNEKEIAQTLSKNDFIYVSGGNTFYLLQELRKSKADKLISEQIKNGKIYIGTSAGSVILSKNIEYLEKVDDKNKAQNLKDYSGLGCVDFYPLPHYKSEPFTEIIEEVFNTYKDQINLIPISNEQVIEVNGSEIKIIG
ncbi:dipeptidase E [Chishuiella changwenlii]|uniref:Dipeptidase E n=1 Tax=Chishuiella changwenlii TaxID=1434701 RepID=A0A1M6ZY97_9FLAO|nr:Type 1 glutamine amidotransferase-like domain-containing protein [Chishuiella changwenlii]GGE92193.1 putative peptidase Lmo0363 [Chishuiella changwenlii]SHL35390.1 dipeptidase E [Chishuiella changwenlii]